jgi:hypothetical protein
MALSFAEWYKQYAQKNGLTLSPEIQSALNNNTLTDPTYETRHKNLSLKLGTTGDDYNSNRNTAAQTARTSAYDAGLSDETSVLEDQRTAGDTNLGTRDAVTYKIKMGPDGRAYRQAYLNTAASFSARKWGGSDEQATQWKARQDLNAARDKITTGLTTDQSTSLTNQGREEQDVMGDMATNASDYAKWRVGATPAAPATSGSGGGGSGGGTPDPTPPAAAPDRYRGVAVGGVLGKYDGSSPNTKTLDTAWGAGNYKIKNVGTAKAPKYQVIRTR